jgi:hypothetical protein
MPEEIKAIVSNNYNNTGRHVILIALQKCIILGQKITLL